MAKMINEDDFIMQLVDEDLVQIRIKDQDYVFDYSTTMDFLLQLAVIAGKMENSQLSTPESQSRAYGAQGISYEQH